MTRYIALVVAAAGFSCAPLAAQAGERTDPHLQNDCRLAEQIVRTGEPAPHREWAYRTITQCADLGPAVLAASWHEPPTDEATLQLLVRATSKLRTRQVFDGLSTAARNPQNSRLVRTYAFSMLYSFAWPGSSLSVPDLPEPGERPARMYQVSGDGAQANGPGMTDLRAEVRALLSEILATEQDAVVLRTARAVLERV
jgi:hypothetical protein